MHRALVLVLLALSVASAAFGQVATLEPVCTPVAGRCSVLVTETLDFVTTAPGATTYSYHWGDGSPPETSSSPVDSHRWLQVGIFIPVLIVTSPSGTGRGASTLPILVHNLNLPPQVPQGIPAMSTWGIVVMVSLIAFAALWLHRSRE